MIDTTTNGTHLLMPFAETFGTEANYDNNIQ